MVQTAPLLGDRGIRVRKVISASAQETAILAEQVWEHYLCFEEYRASVKPIKLSMIRLGSEEVQEEVVIRQGLRYAIVKGIPSEQPMVDGIAGFEGVLVSGQPSAGSELGDAIDREVHKPGKVEQR